MSEMSSVAPENSPVGTEELEIHTIPDKFYGAALRAQVIEEKKPVSTEVPHQTGRSKYLPILLVGIGLILLIGGGFIYFNPQLLFPKKETPPVAVVVETPPPPPPPPLPAAPKATSATSTNPQTVVVNWTDASDNESGFRIERNDGKGVFVSLTSLSPNSTSFLDTSVQPKTTYTYRVRALNSTGESEPSNEASAVTSDLPPAPPEQPKLPPAGLDTDSDGLTDVEETLYVTDTRIPDTDGDGFLDGNEVFHLYNPAGKAPVSLLDSGLVKIFQGTIGWVMRVPGTWVVTQNEADGSKVTIDSRHGETFVITVEENPSKKSIVDWYLESHPGIPSTQILQYRSKGGYTGVIGADLLSTYIPWGGKIFVFTYHLNGQAFINFRTTYSMMLNSLMLSGLPQATSSASTVPLPFEPSATSSGVIANPVPISQPVPTTTTP